MNFKYKVFLAALIFNFAAHADLNNDMEKFFNSAGMQSNSTGAGAYKGQQAGFYTGGSVTARSRVRNLHAASLKLPSISSGCGGIDLYTGGFSFVDTDEIVNTFKSIGNNALGYSFKIALQTMSPMISDVMQDFQNMADEINQFNINSCELASMAGDSAFDMLSQQHSKACARYVGEKADTQDRFAARHFCGKGNQSKAMKEGEKDEDHADTIQASANLAWQALKKAGTNDTDKQMKEFLMSISGSIIYLTGEDAKPAANSKGKKAKKGPDENPGETIYLQSLATMESSSLIKALLHGGEATVYKCDTTDKCLHPVEASVTITQESSFTGQVKSILKSIRDKIKDTECKDESCKLSDKEIYFLGTTSIPIYKMMNVEYAYTFAATALNLDAYAELIAYDFMTQYLNESVEAIILGSNNLSIGSTFLERFKEDATKTKQQLNDALSKQNNNYMLVDDLIRRTQFMEQALAGRLSTSIVNAIGYENGA